MHNPRIYIAAALLFAAGCVTINIYFPAAAAEKAADKIIDEVWQAQKGGKRPEPAPGSEPASGSDPSAPSGTKK